MTKHDASLGFAVIEALLVLVAVGILGLTSWYVYHSQKVASKDYQLQPMSQTTSVNPYSGWKTYTSIDEQFTVRYPSSWTVAATTVGIGQKESTTFFGPDNFSLNYTLSASDPTYTIAEAQKQLNSTGMGNDPADDNYSVISSFTPVNYSAPLYVVCNSMNVNDPSGSLNYIELSAYKNYQSQPLGYPAYYPSKNNSGYVASWYGGYGKLNGGPTGMATTDFLQKNEVKTAIKILESMKYTTN